MDNKEFKSASALEDGTLLHGRWRILGTADTEENSILYDVMDAESGEILRLREFCPMSVCAREGDTLVPYTAEPLAGMFRHGLEEFEQIAQAMHDIPHTVPVTDVFRENGTCYSVKAKAEGKRLFEAAPLLTATYAQSIGILLCDTFAALHRSGIYYGTIHEEDLRFAEGGKMIVRTNHLSLEGSAEHDLRGLTAFLLSMLPIEREENPTAAAVEKALRCSYHDADALKTALLGRQVTRKAPNTAALRGLAGMALCVICLCGAIAGVQHVLTKRQPLTKALKAGKVEPEVISVWLPLQEDADEKAVTTMYKRLAAGFERKNPGCGVNIRIYADGSFEDALSLVQSGAEPPAVYMDTQDELVLRQAADLTPLTESIQNVYIADLSGFGKSLPIGCSIPALYYSVYSSEDLAASKQTTIDFTELPAGTIYDTSAQVFLQSQATAQLPSSCFEDFLTDASSPVLASSSCMALAEHSGVSSGVVQMLPVSVDGEFPVQYEMYCSVSSGVSENTQKVGMLWLQYLLTEEAQQILFVENYGDLPLHQAAFKSAVSVHSGMSSLKGAPLNAMLLQVRR